MAHHKCFVKFAVFPNLTVSIDYSMVQLIYVVNFGIDFTFLVQPCPIFVA